VVGAPILLYKYTNIIFLLRKSNNYPEKLVFVAYTCHTIYMNEFEEALAKVLSEGLAIIDSLTDEQLKEIM